MLAALYMLGAMRLWAGHPPQFHRKSLSRKMLMFGLASHS